jgi:hypothetical protein
MSLRSSLPQHQQSCPLLHRLTTQQTILPHRILPRTSQLLLLHQFRLMYPLRRPLTCPPRIPRGSPHAAQLTSPLRSRQGTRHLTPHTHRLNCQQLLPQMSQLSIRPMHRHQNRPRTQLMNLLTSLREVRQTSQQLRTPQQTSRPLLLRTHRLTSLPQLLHTHRHTLPPQLRHICLHMCQRTLPQTCQRQHPLTRQQSTQPHLTQPPRNPLLHRRSHPQRTQHHIRRSPQLTLRARHRQMNLLLRRLTHQRSIPPPWTQRLMNPPLLHPTRRQRCQLRNRRTRQRTAPQLHQHKSQPHLRVKMFFCRMWSSQLTALARSVMASGISS